MKIAYLVVRTDHASVYYRTLQFLPYLAEQGVEATVHTLPKGLPARFRLFLRLRRSDLVVLQRKLFNATNFLALRFNARRLLFDLDDALFIRDSKSVKLKSLTRTIRFFRTARRSTAVACGNDWVLKRARRFNRKAERIPTVVDTDRYAPPRRHGASETFRAVWIGGRSTLFYLTALIPHLEPLAREIPGFALRVISDEFPDSEAIPIERVPWSRDTEVDAIRGCDAGLMPLTRDDWSRGKCGLKLLQYGAAGLPMVATPVGVNRDIVIEGRTGFQADAPEAWRKALVALARDPGLRAELGRNAREHVEARFSLRAWRAPYLDLLRRTAR